MADVLDSLTALISRLDQIGFQVSLAGTHKVKGILSALHKEPDKSRRVSDEEAAGFGQLVGEVENMVHAESSTKQLYLISENRFNLDALLNKPSTMFAAGILGRVPLIAKQDIALAFRCLAFDQPTATAFHLLRACEAVLKTYYFSCVKRDRLKTPMWANMLEALRKRRDADEKLLNRVHQRHIS